MTVADLKKVCQELVSTGLSQRGFYLWLGEDASLERELAPPQPSPQSGRGNAPLPLHRVDVEELAAGLDSAVRSEEDCRRALAEKLTAVLRPLRASGQRTIAAVTNPTLLARYRVPLTNVLSESLLVIVVLPKPVHSPLLWPEYVRLDPEAAIRFFTAAVGGEGQVVYGD
jgi:hypothetical protein